MASLPFSPSHSQPHNITDLQGHHSNSVTDGSASSVAATPTSSPPTLASLTPVGQIKSAPSTPGVPLVQAVYTDQNGQPLYIVQHMNQPTLIPLQAGQISAATAPNSTVAVSNSAGTVPNSLKLDQSKQQPSLTLHTPPSEGGGMEGGRGEWEGVYLYYAR